MKPLRTLLAGMILLCLNISSFAQEFSVPEATLESKDDYAKYEKDIIRAAAWLESTPIGKEMDKRTQVNTFVIKWISGSPSVNVEIGQLTMKLTDKNPSFIGAFMAAYARYALENNYSKDAVQGNMAGIRSIIKLYNLGGNVKKNKTLQKAMEAEKEGKLEEWVQKNK